MAAALHLHFRNIVSNATCLSQFSWMENKEQKDPCLLVAYVIAACVGNCKLRHCIVVERGETLHFTHSLDATRVARRIQLR